MKKSCPVFEQKDSFLFMSPSSDAVCLYGDEAENMDQDEKLDKLAKFHHNGFYWGNTPWKKQTQLLTDKD